MRSKQTNEAVTTGFFPTMAGSQLQEDCSKQNATIKLIRCVMLGHRLRSQSRLQEVLSRKTRKGKQNLKPKYDDKATTSTGKRQNE